MDFVSNQASQVQEMLKALGLNTIEELFSHIPADLRLPSLTNDDGLSEYETRKFFETLAARNTFYNRDSYLGAGAYDHYVPALVGMVCSKSEFLTAYTPYQPEASQGMLQAIFEFQTAICALTDMDVSNASVYDAASACAEAVLMALRHLKDRKKIWIASTLHPHYRNVVEQYLTSHVINGSVQIEILPHLPNGTLDLTIAQQWIDEDTAAVVMQSPNVFGIVEEIAAISHHLHKSGALLILCGNPLAYGLYASAGEVGADIAVGDCQPFGIPLQYGGPYAGYLACRQDLVRQLPGRLVGETADTQGRRGFVLTLQTREQHIRREKATSNICTNQALAALASLVAMLWYGKRGVQQLALTNYQRAAYLRHALSSISGWHVDESVPIFNEFVVHIDTSMDNVLGHFHKMGIEPGYPLERWYPEYPNALLVAVTELKSKHQLDNYIAAARTLVMS